MIFESDAVSRKRKPPGSLRWPDGFELRRWRPEKSLYLYGGSASHLTLRRNIGTELHRLVLHFPAAGAHGNRRNDRDKNDSALHGSSP
jgi:hypothetical protein